MMTGYAKQSGVPVPTVAHRRVARRRGRLGRGWDLGRSRRLDDRRLRDPRGMVPARLLEDRGPGETPNPTAELPQNVTFLGAALALFAVFASIDHGLRFAVTGSLINRS
jgi:hypothetical protein